MYDEALEKFKLAQTVKPVLLPEILIKIAETYLIKKILYSPKHITKK